MTNKKQLTTINEILQLNAKLFENSTLVFYIKSKNIQNKYGKILQMFMDRENDDTINVTAYSLEDVNKNNTYSEKSFIYDVLPNILAWCTIEPVFYEIVKK